MKMVAIHKFYQFQCSGNSRLGVHYYFLNSIRLAKTMVGLEVTLRFSKFTLSDVVFIANS